MVSHAINKDPRKFERFFRSPVVGDDAIKPSMSVLGVACANIRRALHWLGYDVEEGHQYDAELTEAVQRFQIDNHHPSTDGFFGPGTRKLLVQKMLEKSGPHIFDRLFQKEFRLLFLAADPTDLSRLRLGKEFSEIQKKIEAAKLRERFELHLRLSIQPTEIIKPLLDVQPQIVHFSGHGLATGALAFEDPSGEFHPVSPGALAALFEQFAHIVDCVVLNACYSETQAEAIVRHIDYVVGMNKAIGDEAAIAFSIGFYQALGGGSTIAEAYRLGCVQIGLLGIPEHLTPVLVEKQATL
jgi:hypothetical protein